MPLTRMIMWLMMLMMTMMAMMVMMTVMMVSMGIYNQSEMMGLEVPIPWHLSTAAELSTITLSQVGWKAFYFQVHALSFSALGRILLQ